MWRVLQFGTTTPLQNVKKHLWRSIIFSKIQGCRLSADSRISADDTILKKIKKNCFFIVFVSSNIWLQREVLQLILYHAHDLIIPICYRNLNMLLSLKEQLICRLDCPCILQRRSLHLYSIAAFWINDSHRAIAVDEPPYFENMTAIFDRRVFFH